MSSSLTADDGADLLEDAGMGARPPFSPLVDEHFREEGERKPSAATGQVGTAVDSVARASDSDLAFDTWRSQ